VFYDRTFVDFVKDNFSRFLRAVDRDPGMEVPVISNGVPKGISREMVDSLRSQLEEKDKTLQKAEQDFLSLERQLGQEQADHRRAKETAAVELSRIKNVTESLQKSHDEEIRKQQAEHARIVQDHQRQLDHVQKTADANADRSRRRMEAEISNLQSDISKLETSLAKANKNHVQDLQTAHEEYTINLKEQTKRLKLAEEKAVEFETKSNALNARLVNAEALLVEKENERKATQSELDDLLMVFGDLEDKTQRYKERLKQLGESVSDGEDEVASDEDRDDGVD